jgi:hypothetical protein
MADQPKTRHPLYPAYLPPTDFFSSVVLQALLDEMNSDALSMESNILLITAELNTEAVPRWRRDELELRQTQHRSALGIIIKYFSLIDGKSRNIIKQ